MGKAILSRNKSQHECVFKDTPILFNTCFETTVIRPATNLGEEGVGGGRCTVGPAGSLTICLFVYRNVYLLLCLSVYLCVSMYLAG